MKPYNSDKSKKEEVQRMFDNIAPTYDRLNHLFSLSIDKAWRRRVMRKVRRMNPERILDLATGTGDLAIKMSKRMPHAKIMGVDLSENMLAIAAEKVRRQGLEDHVALYQGDAENLDLGDGVMDVVTVAFGVRNFGNIEQGLREIWRVLASGGHLVVLEFSTPRNFLVRKAYQLYSNHVMKPVGGLVSHDRRAYDYLPDSIVEFPEPNKFLDILRQVGFDECRRHSQSFGIAQIYIARKP
ncbi:MAG: bifunctional demethylmenaquinone methyltransferase/2-methoxy-6-polyprenyl-1,4-benzoquinol methylase UbiE [Alistipes sp.]|nr:bifunctional demethylmenaquinone methyltransferase/2-methoxy-6-polyprenyl-1,4-benzoquinol methylase UbiE [Alistipes sp.]MBR2399480.1 bifunctional demethylmenaquinone methyltransferase/2-methoxy-6-polyprenyl-1,4-benzoquinol methylase UbiE [Alistipes sp.]MBR6662843.1 bifunctional demethylmenaquinone methyltransferase/2-methoxy-6-polyprenyl-1,4-benzoquinol methylase UbiE [Alistipes sp.]MBR7097331.1 bifunctional demethylmenaquinone methyltransferase/2-methoxy-6-polyprenyl-1,4-benzoquinol methylas